MHNETLSVAAVRVSNPDCSPLSESMAETEPQLQLALLRLSATISQYRFTLAGAFSLFCMSLSDRRFFVNGHIGCVQSGLF